MPTDDYDAPTALYLEQWLTELVADRQQIEVIFVEDGYDVVNQPLRDIESGLVLQDCLKSTPLPGPGAKRPSDTASPEGSPEKRQRTEPEADPLSTPALDADAMRAVLGQSPVSTIVSDADRTPPVVAATPDFTATPQEEEPSLVLTTPEMSFDEPALRNPTQADTPEREFVEDEQEYWEDTPQRPLSDLPGGTTGTDEEEETTGIEEENGPTGVDEEEETAVVDEEGTTGTEEEEIAGITVKGPTASEGEAEDESVCDEMQEESLGRDESLTTDDGIASDDGDSSAARSRDTASSEESSDDEDEHIIPHIRDLFREDVDNAQPDSDDEHSDADNKCTDDELMSGDDEVVVAGEARLQEIQKKQRESERQDNEDVDEEDEWEEDACDRCRKLCSLRYSTEGPAKFDFEVPTKPSIPKPATFRGSVSLYPHQLTGMEWMEVREQCGDCRGGILADAPGCGKTVTVGGHLSRQKLKIVNVVRRLQFDNESSDSEIEVDEDPNPMPLFVLSGKRKARGALVVTPKAVIEQWKEQLTKTFMRRNALRVCMFYENERDKISDEMLATYDLVLTTFTTLQVDVLGYRRKREFIKPKCRLSQFHWSRIILDEAHQTKTEKARTRSHVVRYREEQRLTKLKACLKIDADIRWCVTGTPMDGRVEHLDALFEFLRAPRSTPKKELMLMRTKEGVVDVKKIWHDEDIELEKTERKFYNQMADFIKKWKEEANLNRKWVSENRAQIEAMIARIHPKTDPECSRQSHGPSHVAYWNKYDELCKAHPKWKDQSPQWEYLCQAFPMYRTLNGFTADLRLRQISVHMAIAEKAVGTGDAVDDAARALDEEVRKRLLENGVSRADLKRIFKADHESSKMKRLLELLVPTAKNGEKCVVVSQWESLLQIVGRHLDKARISHEIMSGKISAKERFAITQRFNNSESKPQVLLLASQSCGTGVDLPGGMHMFLMEPQKSAALEEQVFNRLHRIGQTKDVHCYRLVAVDTIEERVVRQRMDRECETKKYFTK